MTIPDFQTLMLPVLQEIAGVEEKRTGDLVAAMADKFKLSSEEREELLPSGRQPVIANRTHWAVAYLTKTGLLERTRRAHYRLAPRGRSVLTEAPARIDLRYLSRFPELALFRGEPERPSDTPSTVEASGATPDELMRTAYAQIDSALRQDLLTRVLAAPPAFFEQLVVTLLVRMGFGGQHGLTAKAIGRAGDGGIDGVVDQDALGLDRVYVQAKRYALTQTVGPGTIHEFFGSLDAVKASKEVFVTTSSFTGGASKAAERLSKRIVLVDGEQLAGLMIRYDVGVRIEEVFQVKKVDEDFFLDS